MEVCRKKRREEAIKSISSMAHLQDYPALKLPEILSRNFIYSVNFLLLIITTFCHYTHH